MWGGGALVKLERGRSIRSGHYTSSGGYASGGVHHVLHRCKKNFFYTQAESGLNSTSPIWGGGQQSLGAMAFKLGRVGSSSRCFPCVRCGARVPRLGPRIEALGKPFLKLLPQKIRPDCPPRGEIFLAGLRMLEPTGIR